MYAASTVTLDGCVFSDNHAALGSAVSNVVNFGLQNTAFSGNALLCDDSQSFLNWNTNVSPNAVLKSREGCVRVHDMRNGIPPICCVRTLC